MRLLTVLAIAISAISSISAMSIKLKPGSIIPNTDSDLATVEDVKKSESRLIFQETKKLSGRTKRDLFPRPRVVIINRHYNYNKPEGDRTYGAGSGEVYYNFPTGQQYNYNVGRAGQSYQWMPTRYNRYSKDADDLDFSDSNANRNVNYGDGGFAHYGGNSNESNEQAEKPQTLPRPLSPVSRSSSSSENGGGSYQVFDHII